MKFHTVTLGCQMNKSDSERVNTVIEEMGFNWTDKEDEADLLGIIACSVRQKAIDKVYTKIHKWNTWKNKKNPITFVTGCILSADRDKFLKQFDMIFQICDLVEFPEMLRQYGIVNPFSISRINEFKGEKEALSGQAFNFKTIVIEVKRKVIAGNPVPMKQPEIRIGNFWHIAPRYQSDFEAFIPIQNGCDKFCTFCAVPYTRGREISRSSHEILDELKTLVMKGYKAITLLGQNVNSYGLDKNGDEISFPALLRRIGEFGNTSGLDFWVYFTSPHPRDMTDEVIQTVAEFRCLAKQIHLPLQSGDDTILARMNRNHKFEDYHRVIESIRKFLPQATIFTDIIVGFTGESDEQFKNTCLAMEKIRFNMAYIARYSPRPGAVSAKWNNDVSHEIKRQRLHTLSSLLQALSYNYNLTMIGNICKVLVTGFDRKNQFLTGLTEGKIIVRFNSADHSLIGRFVDIKIISVAEFSVEGNLVNIYKTENVQA